MPHKVCALKPRLHGRKLLAKYHGIDPLQTRLHDKPVLYWFESGFDFCTCFRVSQQTEGGTNVIFARPSRSNTSDEVSGQNYQNAHLVFVTESNRGVIQQREARTEMARFQCETRNPCAFQPYTLNGLDRELGPIHMSVCYCSPDKVVRRLSRFVRRLSRFVRRLSRFVRVFL
ncbi:hypothetical protein TNCT_629551, partial [Trichonephila clavata]